MTIHIHTPIWGSQSVGIAQNKISIFEKLIVKIDYKDKYGNELYPYYLVIDGKETKKYPTQIVKGTKLRIIPIADFEKMKPKETK